MSKTRKQHQQWYLEPINWTLSGRGYSEKNIQQVFIHLLGKQQLFNPKDVRHQVLAPTTSKSTSVKQEKQQQSKMRSVGFPVQRPAPALLEYYANTR